MCFLITTRATRELHSDRRPNNAINWFANDDVDDVDDDDHIDEHDGMCRASACVPDNYKYADMLWSCAARVS